MITVELYHVRAGKTEAAGRDQSANPHFGQEKIHEKHLKGQAISTQAK